MHPIILIGTSLKDIYTLLDAGLKKNAALTAGIEDSNMRGSLDFKRNISKKTLRKLATGLDVYPILFFVPSKNIKSELLRYNSEEGIKHIANFNNFLELIHLKEDFDAEAPSLNSEIISALDNLFDEIHLVKKNKQSQKDLKQKICDALISLTSSINEQHG